MSHTYRQEEYHDCMTPEMEQAFVTTLVICGPPPPTHGWNPAIERNAQALANRNQWLSNMTHVWDKRFEQGIGEDVGQFIELYEIWWDVMRVTLCGSECDPNEGGIV